MTGWEIGLQFVGPVFAVGTLIAYAERRFTRLETVLERVERGEAIKAEMAEVRSDIGDLRRWKHDTVAPALQQHESRIAVIEAIDGVHDRRHP